MPNASSALITLTRNPGQLNSCALAALVRGHRPVVVEMIAREIGEKRDLEAHAVDASLVDSVRRDLHRDRFSAERDLNCASISCSTAASRVVCVDGRIDVPIEAVAQRPEDRCAPTCGVQRGGDPVRRRGLAVRARDADDPQLRERMAVHESAIAPKRDFEMLAREVRQPPAWSKLKPCGSQRIAACVAVDGVGDERRPSYRAPGVRRESVARAQIATVAGDARRPGYPGAPAALRSRRRRRRFRRWQATRRSWVLAGGAHVSSSTWRLRAARLTLFSGASVGTESRRSAAPITLLNTGAATAPAVVLPARKAGRSSPRRSGADSTRARIRRTTPRTDRPIPGPVELVRGSGLAGDAIARRPAPSAPFHREARPFPACDVPHAPFPA